jgi:hypothetical protein
MSQTTTKSKLGARLAAAAAAAAATLLVATTAGCESDRSSMNEFFPTGPRTPHVFAAAHVDAGARTDATLSGAHFDGTRLNALGRERVEAILEDRDPASGPTTVYLSFADTEDTAARGAAVVDHARTLGLDEDDVTFVSGPNPRNTSFTADHMARMKRAESDGEGGSMSGTGFDPGSDKSGGSSGGGGSGGGSNK